MHCLDVIQFVGWPAKIQNASEPHAIPEKQWNRRAITLILAILHHFRERLHFHDFLEFQEQGMAITLHFELCSLHVWFTQVWKSEKLWPLKCINRCITAERRWKKKNLHFSMYLREYYKSQIFNIFQSFVDSKRNVDLSHVGCLFLWVFLLKIYPGRSIIFSQLSSSKLTQLQSIFTTK